VKCRGRCRNTAITYGEGAVPLEQEQDLVVFADDDGNELTLEVLDYFYYNGQEYAVLTGVDEDIDDEDAAEVEEDEQAQEDSLYIMKVVPVEGDQEEFVPVEDELLEKLVEIVQTRFDELDDDDLDGDES